VETSRDFHLRVMEDDEFRRGAIEIQWLERRLPSIIQSTPPDEGIRTAAIAAALIAHRDRTGGVAAPSNGRSGDADGTSPSSNQDVSRRDAWKQAARREAVADR
jgi:acetyl-CoA carboxylase biotin carboxylase subunit